jgi:serine/threonine-protein phosphatase 6 catalytic subunit
VLPHLIPIPQFNHVNALRLIARAHQLVQEGFKYMFDEKLVTVWSAPNYCYRCGNLASILTIRETGEREFTVFNAAEENQHDRNMQVARRIVRKINVLLCGCAEVCCTQGSMPYFV